MTSPGLVKTALVVRRHNYGVLAYYERMAKKALLDNNMAEHMKWGEKYHDLAAQMDAYQE